VSQQHQDLNQDTK